MNPYYQRAHFIASAPRLDQSPDDTGHEIAFAGRSNAGKSSAINALCHQKALARTSKTPGRTQHLVFFGLDEEHRLVDLPGYGYAKVSEAIKRQWQAHLAEYLEQRRSLGGLVIVMDIRRPLSDFDRQMIEWSVGAELPLLLLLTKADKLSRNQAARTVLEVKKAVAKVPLAIEILPFSATQRQGVEAAQSWLDVRLGLASQTP